MEKLNRRTFLGSSLAAAMFLPAATTAAPDSFTAATEATQQEGPAIIDTNVNLLGWPFRKLKYGDTRSLVQKLRKHRISQAWAGSFEALFHKDVDGVNARLADECRAHGDGMLIPFGTVNLAWGDWEEDLRRCHVTYRMPGIRIYPGYQTFDTDHPEFSKLIERATALGMLVQIAGDMEDTRTHHPILRVGGMKAEALIEVVKKIPGAAVQLVYWNHQVAGKSLEKLIAETNISLDTSRIEGTGVVGRLIAGTPWSGSARPVPVERLVFGSHAPYFPVEANLLKLFESPLTLSQMKSIMTDNARRLLKTS